MKSPKEALRDALNKHDTEYIVTWKVQYSRIVEAPGAASALELDL